MEEGAQQERGWDLLKKGVSTENLVVGIQEKGA